MGDVPFARRVGKDTGPGNSEQGTPKLGPTLPYQGLSYPDLREAHDRIYFGAWRGTSPTLVCLQEAHRQLGSFLDALEHTLGPDSPGRAKECLAKAREAYRQADPEASTDSTILLAINNALSYGHRVLDILLREKGDPIHASREFAQYYDGVGHGDGVE